jgi:hypothetical protein
MNRKRHLVIVGIVAAAALVSILLYTMVANHGPVITSLAAEPEGVPPLGSCQIVCNASAPHGSELSYNWSASGGTITGEGATVTWGAPGYEGSYNVTVTVSDSRGGEATDYVIIPVRTNSPPSIDSLVANAAWVSPSGNLQVTCNATDPNGDELSYEWTTDGGKISGTGTNVKWTAPREVGAYNVTVVVKDGYGGEDIRKMPLCVDRGTPPAIENLIVTGKDNPYLKEDGQPGCDYEVFQTKKYDIDCIASNTSGELSYEWSCTAGSISREGSNITWTAPSTPPAQSIKVAVTVIVSNVAGNRVGKDIVFYVSYCTCPFH